MQKSPECGKNCSLANRDCQSQNTIKESKAGTPQQAKKTYAECAANQHDTNIRPTCKSAPAKDHIFSTAGKKTANRGKHNQILFNIQWNGQSEKRA